MCSVCGNGFRLEATDLATGRVKAVLHPVRFNLPEILSTPSAGSLTLATGDVTVSDIWPHLTGIYFSRVVDDERQCLWAGYVDQYAIPRTPELVSVGVVSMDTYLSERVMANADEGISYAVDDRQQTLIAKDYVDMAQWNGIPLTAIAEPSEFEREASYLASDYKNLGQALAELVAVDDGPEYTLEHTYNDPGMWSSVIRFQDVVGDDRNIFLKSDREGLNCGITSDAKSHATRAYAIGAGTEEQQLVSIAHDAATIYPEFHASPAWKDTADVSTLETRAVGHVATFRDPTTTPTMSIAGMEPDPDVLRVGDTVSALIIAKSFSFGDPKDPTGPSGKARLSGVEWVLQVDAPIIRVLTLQPVIRPALSILVKSIIPPEVPGDNQPSPGDGGTEPVGGLVTTIKDGRIQESSGLQITPDGAGVYTHNDEGESPQVYLVDLATGNTTSEWALTGVSSLSDPESIREDPTDGSIWIPDIGDNDNNRTTKRLIQTNIPASGASLNFNITYPGGVKQNAEGFAIHPSTGKKYVLTKAGNLYEYPATLSANNVGSHLYSGLAANVSDMTFTPDGRFLLCTVAGQAATLVIEFSSGTQVGTINTDNLPKGESITMEPSGKSFLIGSEGKNSPIYRVVLPSEYRAPNAGSGSVSPNGLPSGVIDLTNWKLNLPVCPYTEIKQPQLATYENPSWFFDDTGPVVVFRANAGGCTTSGSQYPRSELREMSNGGTTNASWNPAAGTHTMVVNLSMSTGTLSAKKHVVGAQVHDASDDVCVFRLEDTSLYLTDGDNPHGTLITNSYVNGTMFEAKFVGSNGSIKAYYNGALVATRPAGSGCYFKTGCYTQSNTSKGDAPGAYGEVKIASVVVTHA